MACIRSDTLSGTVTLQDTVALQSKVPLFFRDNMTDVVVQHLIHHTMTRIRCNDLVKKVAIYGHKLAVGGSLSLFEEGKELRNFEELFILVANVSSTDRLERASQSVELWRMSELFIERVSGRNSDWLACLVSDLIGYSWLTRSNFLELSKFATCTVIFRYNCLIDFIFTVKSRATGTTSS